MGEMMTFPASVEEFMEQNKMIDTEHVYSNGTEFVPIYRMKQWLEHVNYNDGSGVQHGRWEDKPNPQWRAYDIRYCSACGWSIHKTKLRKSDLNWEYCPNCGCKMDLEG